VTVGGGVTGGGDVVDAGADGCGTGVVLGVGGCRRVPVAGSDLDPRVLTPDTGVAIASTPGR